MLDSKEKSTDMAFEYLSKKKKKGLKRGGKKLTSDNRNLILEEDLVTYDT